MHEYTSTTRVWELLCPGLPEEVGRARHWTRDVLGEHPRADDAALIVTELVTNAITHAASPDFRLTLRRVGSALTLTVTDRGRGVGHPRTAHPGDDDAHGRGLVIVHLLADPVRIACHPLGHTVTVHLAIPARKAASC
ncbi:ATP-binding protein [Streptomyces sp. NPDC058405]|uniref:ATP-binding protein n=1 Tax=Streptomyces sp. NPDC058405 TaxID=3346482 RepID=UPI0036617EE7